MKTNQNKAEKPIFSAKDICISFGSVNVLKNIKLDIYQGEAVGIVGENGAGKSTLMRILTGIYKPTSGSLIYKNQLINVNGVKEAREKYKISIIHQEQQLCDQLTVAQNIFLGSETRNKFGLLSAKEINEKTQKILNELGVDFNSKTLVKYLSVSQRQFVEIAKSLIQKPEIIIFDEPTSVLTQKDTEKLYKIIDKLKEQKKSIIWITHRMEEIVKICEQILIIKDGNYITQKPFQAFKNMDEVVNLMVGRELENRYPDKIKITLTKTKNFKVQNLNSQIHKNVNLEIYGGEIVVLYGLVGSGRTELAKILLGTLPYSSGTFSFNNHFFVPHSPQKALENKIFYLCEDRKQLGLNVKQSINFNINLSNLSKSRNVLGMVMNSKEKKFSNKYINKLSIKTDSFQQYVENLSGGNQQKVAIAKGLNTQPDFFIFDEPTRGVDVGARKDIYEIISHLKKSKRLVLVISSDLPEVLGIADRVITFFEGSVTANLIGEDINEQTIIKYALNV